MFWMIHQGVRKHPVISGTPERPAHPCKNENKQAILFGSRGPWHQSLETFYAARHASPLQTLSNPAPHKDSYWTSEKKVTDVFLIPTQFTLDLSIPSPSFQLNRSLKAIMPRHPQKDLNFQR